MEFTTRFDQEPPEWSEAPSLTVDYDQLTKAISRVLTTGTQRLAQLAALEDPWSEHEAPEVAEAPPPAEKPADLPAPGVLTLAETRAETRAVPKARPFAGHPILDHIDDEPSEGNMLDWMQRCQREARAPFEPMWAEAIRRVRAKEFTKQAALSAAYGKSDKWAADFRKVVVSQGVMKSDAEWWSCFQKTKKGTSAYDPQLTAHRSAGTPPQLTRISFEEVMQKERNLDFDTVIQMIRLRCWATAHDFCEHFHQRPAWTVSLRAFVIREGLFTAESWVRCFGRDRRTAQAVRQLVSQGR